MSQQNEAVVRRVIEEGWNRGNLTVVDDCLADAYTQEGPLETVRGPEGQKAQIAKYRAAFPDCHLQIDELISAGDRVVVRYTYSGTQRGELAGIPPTGRSVIGHGIDLLHLVDGRIVASYSQWDALGLMQQLGVLTLPGTAKAAGV